MKAMKVKLVDSYENHFIWTVKSYEGIHIVDGQKPHTLRGWQYIDHEGYQRTVEGNWSMLVDAFKLTAENYGLKTTLSKKGE